MPRLTRPLGALVAVVTGALFLTACGGADNADPSPSTPEPTSTASPRWAHFDADYATGEVSAPEFPDTLGGFTRTAEWTSTLAAVDTPTRLPGPDGGDYAASTSRCDEGRLLVRFGLPGRDFQRYEGDPEIVVTVPAVDGVPSTAAWGETHGSAGYLVMSACDTPAFSAAQNDTLDVEVSVQQWSAAPVAADKLDDYRHGDETLYFKSAGGTLFCGISSTAAGCVGVLVDAARNTPVADCWEHRAGPAAHRILLHTDEPAEFDCPGDPSFGIDNPDTVAVLPVGSTLAAHGFTCVNTTSSSSERITCRTDAHGFSAGTFLADVDLY